MSDFSVGQRWISNTEAHLGLGIITGIAQRSVTISFPAAAEERTYAIKNAPITRIIYQIGDQVTNIDGVQFTVADVHQGGGQTIYKVVKTDGSEHIMPELELDCFVHFNTPKDRLLSGQVDPLKFFELRYQALNYQRSYQQSGAVGLLGPRVQLLPHQLYIAHLVGSRVAPRVLLADEVGLGKTIEAGLILHQQLQTGLASRVLILVPDSLLHQWLVEMLRRFNLSFSVLDEQICEELSHDEQNPFETSQLILCPLSFLVNNPERHQQALSCQWDILLVDEAHHLEWKQDNISAEYQCVESLANIAKGVLLLTATPEQLGLESHFARLRLLDPDRYYDFEKFIAEEQQFKPVNLLVQELAHTDELTALPKALSDYLGKEEIADIEQLLTAGFSVKASEKAINALLDRHGTGRILFRNTRAAVKGFPKRILNIYPLTFNESHAIAAPVTDWLQIETIFGSDWIALDERIQWLKEFLKKHRHEKLLLICARAETAIELEEYLRYREGIRSAVFHEGMSLIARDRAAAYFAEEEDSAQILICSEIGSEGRNFQFSHHIIMFDLPLNPDLLEQRIGRLDRIGQTSDVHIHVPYYEDTAQAVLVNWYHRGLNAFEDTCAIGHTVFEEFQQQLLAVLEQGDSVEIDNLINETATRAVILRQAMHDGRDQLLEMNSFRPDEAAAIIDAVIAGENRWELEDFIEQFSDQLGVNMESHSQDAIILHPSEHMRSGNLPGLKEEGITATYSREMALSREDMAFLSWEHPIVSGALDMILSGDHGNTALGTIKLKPLKEGTLLLEALYTVECIAPAELRLSRYLPTTIIRTLVNIDGKDLSDILVHDKLSMLMEKLPLQTVQALAKQARPQVEILISHAEKIAATHLPGIIDDAKVSMLVNQQVELTRLEALAKVNPNIRQEEIDILKSSIADLAHCIEQASIRLNAVRLIMAV